MTAVLRTRPVAKCPRCSTSLDGGPVVFWCGPCRIDVPAADLSNEVAGKVTDCSHLHSAFGAGCPHCAPPEGGLAMNAKIRADGHDPQGDENCATGLCSHEYPEPPPPPQPIREARASVIAAFLGAGKSTR